MRTYTELNKLKTFEERFNYLKQGSIVGAATFGGERYLNQVFYNSDEWKKARRTAIIRDNGCDLGCEDYPIGNKIYVHHMNPVTIKDIQLRNPDLFNPEYLICCSHKTHNAIHYGDEEQLPKQWEERKPGDTCPWKKGNQMTIEKLLEQSGTDISTIDDIGDFSDGFHTFNSLYYQRLVLFAAIVNRFSAHYETFKSLKHEDGELCFGGDWFIVGIKTIKGWYTYHYETKYWDMFNCPVLEKAPHWDGHTDKDVTRLLSL